MLPRVDAAAQARKRLIRRVAKWDGDQTVAATVPSLRRAQPEQPEAGELGPVAAGDGAERRLRFGALAGHRQRGAEPDVDQARILAAFLQRRAVELGRFGILAVAVKGVAGAARDPPFGGGQRLGAQPRQRGAVFGDLGGGGGQHRPRVGGRGLEDVAAEPFLDHRLDLAGQAGAVGRLGIFEIVALAGQRAGRAHQPADVELGAAALAGKVAIDAERGRASSPAVG